MKRDRTILFRFLCFSCSLPVFVAMTVAGSGRASVRGKRRERTRVKERINRPLVSASYCPLSWVFAETIDGLALGWLVVCSVVSLARERPPVTR